MISALIPARGGSKGIPNKNILEINGYPLIAYSIVACKLCSKIERVYVSTEDEQIANIAKCYGAIVIHRPNNLAMDCSTDYDVLKHFFELFSLEEEVAYIRPTTPKRNPLLLSNYVELYEKNKDFITGMRSMHELSESPYKYFKINDDGFCQGFFEDFNGIKDYTNLPRQLFPIAYHPNGYVDVIKKETIDSGSDFGNKILPCITERSYELDIKEDINIVKNDLLNSQIYSMIKK